jgi:hypothetical protein
MARLARTVVASLRWSPHAALVALALAIVAHLIGFAWLAEIYGDAAFFLAAIAVCARNG